LPFDAQYVPPPEDNVVKFVEEENEEFPLEQTVCTWNSYWVLDVRDEIAFDVMVEVAEVHVAFPTTRY